MRQIAALLIVSGSLLAQQAGEYSISGAAINAETGEPVKYALITLMRFEMPDPKSGEPSTPARPLRKMIQAGPGGEFQFLGLGPGHYSINAEKPGFNLGVVPQGSRSQVDLTSSISGLQLKLFPNGVIEGTAVDQNDEPLRGVNIIALQESVNDGWRQTTSVRSVATDDRGKFRLWNLAPGRYYLKAAGKSGGTYRYIGEGTPYYSSWQSFPPIYLGGGRTLDAATQVQIEYGSKITADFRLTLEPAFKIRGTLLNAPPDAVTFELLQGSEDVSASRASLNSTTGKFEVQDVTPGTYLLRATLAGKPAGGVASGAMRGEAVVAVNGADVNDVSISLEPAVTVQGRTRMVGTPLKIRQTPGFDRMISALGADAKDYGVDFDQPVPTSCNVSLHPPGGGARNTPGGVPRSRSLMGGKLPPDSQHDGAFAIDNVLPGPYTVRIQCDGGYVISALAGDVDLLANPNLVIQPGVPPSPIEVQYRPGGGTIDGELDIHPLPKAPGVLLVPAFSNSTGPMMIPVAGDFPSPEKPQFGGQFLAPGDYVAYAFSDWQQVEFRNPAVLQALSGGVSVHVEEGKETHLTITKVAQ